MAFPRRDAGTPDATVGMDAEEDPMELTNRDEKARAVRVTSAYAHDAEDLGMLLDMLGLKAADVLPEPADAGPEVPAPQGKGLPMAELTALLATLGRQPA
ncbi:hypothetical protein FPZ12_017815 [Amycolatopsis acidicola]|uniref:Uncharacterized protein n=1 Tax=Amycolatopsis acidicola TaxID=2596893 RepID=A0A5N0V177_9PSEU|nr:hypothetical protein [Amycolatopsis acidicola]KAA9160209.1 hypothetical protein FPZ12_017815 [Amycolatopsis acidicola]